jgi:ABC-type antimicrobial peptide transport system permease subunit
VSTLGRVPAEYVYLPGGEDLLIGSRLDLGTLAPSIHRIVRALDPGLVVSVIPLEANLGFWRGLSTTLAGLGAALGGLALLLAAVGIYGVVSYSVSRRYHEIGIRMALGASMRNVLGTILGRTMRPVLIGAVLGIGAASFISRMLAGVLFGVSPADPLGIGGAALFVLGVALVAALIAARPAARAVPTTTLRYI